MFCALFINIMKNKQLPPKQFCIPFVVNEKAYAFWDNDIQELNLRFINQIDSEYFEYIAQLNLSLLNGEGNEKKTRQHAAMNMRIAYSQGLEVLFSFIFAAIQAHDCIIGWFLKYRNQDLLDIAEKFRDGKEIYTKLALPVSNFRDFANIVFAGVERDRYSKKIEQFGYLWNHFFKDFLDEKIDKEYNSLKHGLRVEMGGRQYLMGLPEFKGKPVENQQWRVVSQSEFGTAFFISEQIDKTPNHIVHRHSRNWHPENYFHGLMLISTSIKNILVLLNKINGSKKDVNYYFPNDEYFSELPWAVANTVCLTRHSTIDTNKIPLLTKEDILSIYQTEETD